MLFDVVNGLSKYIYIAKNYILEFRVIKKMSVLISLTWEVQDKYSIIYSYIYRCLGSCVCLCAVLFKHR